MKLLLGKESKDYKQFWATIFRPFVAQFLCFFFNFDFLVLKILLESDLLLITTARPFLSKKPRNLKNENLERFVQSYLDHLLLNSQNCCEV